MDFLLLFELVFVIRYLFCAVTSEIYVSISIRNFSLFIKSLFYSSNPLKWLPYQNLGGKTLKNVQIDPQKTEIWPKELFVRLSISEGHPSLKKAELLKGKTIF